MRTVVGLSDAHGRKISNPVLTNGGPLFPTARATGLLLVASSKPAGVEEEDAVEAPAQNSVGNCSSKKGCRQRNLHDTSFHRHLIFSGRAQLRSPVDRSSDAHGPKIRDGLLTNGGPPVPITR